MQISWTGLPRSSRTRWGAVVCLLIAVASVAILAVTMARGQTSSGRSSAAAQAAAAMETGDAYVLSIDLPFLRQDSSPASVSVIDARDGTTLISEEVDFGPMAALRTSAGELLLSYTDDQESGAQLHVVDLASGEETHVVPMTGRVDPMEPPGTAWLLSSDEAYLYYLQRQRICDGDAALCDRDSIGVIDLGQWAFVGSAELPSDCIASSFQERDQSDLQVFCAGTLALYAISHTAQAEQLAQFGPGPQYTVDTYEGMVGPIWAGALPDAGFAIVFADGTVRRQDPSGRVISTEDWLAGSASFQSTTSRLGQTLVLARRESNTDATAQLTIVDLSSLAASSVSVDPDTRDFALLGDGRIALLQTTGLGLLDPRNGVVSEVPTISSLSAVIQ